MVVASFVLAFALTLWQLRRKRWARERAAREAFEAETARLRREADAAMFAELMRQQTEAAMLAARAHAAAYMAELEAQQRANDRRHAELDEALREARRIGSIDSTAIEIPERKRIH